MPSATLLAQSAITGVLSGALYGLLALGLSLSWGLLRLVNIGHFAMALLGAYLTWWLGTVYGIPAWASGPFIVAAFAFWGPPASGQTVVQDIGGTQLLFSGPANPRATIFVFAGGDGTVSFNSAGQITHLAGNFLLRTQSLWQAQGFAFATLASSSPLYGQRHTPAYAAMIGRAISISSRPTRPSPRRPAP